MSNPIFYVDEPDASSYAIVGDDPSERRGFGARPVIGDELAVFPTRAQAEDHARQFDQGEVVEVDVIVGHAPS
jgi:hypothetical protein